jgi:hypothetical protein
MTLVCICNILLLLLLNVYFRIYRTVHLRNRKGVSTLLPPDHMEHEGQLLQG